jgi:ABC-2 type transport system ATP-binding protein
LEERLERTLATLSLASVASVRAGELPRGLQQRLAFACAILHRPEVLVLDEPTSGVDPSARREFWQWIYEWAGQGRSVLVTTHYMDEAEYANRVALMFEGRLLALDTPASLKARYARGRVWELRGRWEASTLTRLEALEEVEEVITTPQYWRLLTRDPWEAAPLRERLRRAGVPVAELVPASPTLEDVFVLAGRTAEEEER